MKDVTIIARHPFTGRFTDFEFEFETKEDGNVVVYEYNGGRLYSVGEYATEDEAYGSLFEEFDHTGYTNVKVA